MIKEKIKNTRDKITNPTNEYGKLYKITDYILFFFAFSLIGWIWEVCLVLVQTGKMVNRGVLLGPWLPIYGSGGVLILLLLRKMFNKPIVTFFSMTILCTVIEYITSWYLEVTKGVRWWDYSNYLLNINGRVCLEGAIVFGIGGCAVVYLLAPKLSKVFNKLSNYILVPICVILTFLFTIDFIYSHYHPNMGEGVTISRTSITKSKEIYINL